jgi:phosphatidylglycerol---prolipoprotein diacylglyceryl transferase
VLPELFTAGPLTVYSYGVLLAAAYLLGLRLAMSRARQRQLDPTRMLDLGIYIIISALVGAKALLVIVEWDHFTSSPQEFLSLARSGGVFYGGLILAVAVAFWYIRRHRLPFWQTCDVFAPGIALGHAIGRLGCLAAGCCYGRPTEVAWAVTFRDPAAAANVGTPLGVPLHPTQIYESAAELLILGLLVTTERRGRSFAGRTLWLYMLLYGLSRLLIEFFRYDPRGLVGSSNWVVAFTVTGDRYGTLSTSQVISLIIVPLSLVMLWWLSRQPQGAPVPAEGATRKGASGTRGAGR